MYKVEGYNPFELLQLVEPTNIVFSAEVFLVTTELFDQCVVEERDADVVHLYEVAEGGLELYYIITSLLEKFPHPINLKLGDQEVSHHFFGSIFLRRYYKCGVDGEAISALSSTFIV